MDVEPQPPARRGRRSRRLLALGVALLVVTAGILAAVGTGVAQHVVRALRATTTTLSPAQQAQQRAFQQEQRAIGAAQQLVGVTLPQQPGSAAPALPATGPRHSLPPHQVVAYLPYWYLSDAPTLDVASLTTIAYWSLDLGSDGSILQSGSAWGDLTTPNLATLVMRAHAAGDRILLSVDSANGTVLDAISGSPVAASQHLLPTLEHLVKQFGFDGVNLDLEGRNGADRAGFARFVQLVSAGLKATDPHWEVAIDTYPQSASDPNDFFDVAAIAPSVDQFFIMAYDLYQPGVPSADAPLTGTSISVSTALQSYTAIVPATKIVLGVPFYGDDWTLDGPGTSPDQAAGPNSLTYSTIVAGKHPARWDPATDTVFFDYKANGHDHQVWYDDPLSIALKAALASEYHVAGVGMWADGMQGSSSSLLTALLGGSAPLKLPLAG
jgi:spore germination protein